MPLRNLNHLRYFLCAFFSGEFAARSEFAADGVFRGLGTSPSRIIRSLPMFVGSGSGMDESSACVYGCAGFVYRSSLSAISTMFPKYMTPIRSDMCLTIDRSCAMNKYVTPVSSWMSCSMFTTCAWTETSSAEIGSSHRIKSGFTDSARAILMRWRWPR